MDNEKLQRWALIAEIVGGIAIVLSLVFVGLEIRQSANETELNTTVTRVNAYQELRSHLVALSDLQISNPEYYVIESKMAGGGSPESEDEVRIYGAHLLKVAAISEMAYFQYANGLISDSQLYAIFAAFRVHLIFSPFARDYWNSVALKTYDAGFRDYVERIILQDGVNLRN